MFLLLFLSMLLLTTTVSTFLTGVVPARKQFAGDFLISNLVVDSPFQAQPNSSASSLVWCKYHRPYRDRNGRRCCHY